MFIVFFSVRKAEVGPSQVPHVTAVRWTSRSVWHLFLEVLNSPRTCSIVKLPLLSTGLLTLTCLGDCWDESQGEERKIELKCWESCSAARKPGWQVIRVMTVEGGNPQALFAASTERKCPQISLCQHSGCRRETFPVTLKKYSTESKM